MGPAFYTAIFQLPQIVAATDTLPGLPAPAQYGILGIAVVVLASAKVVVPVGWLKDAVNRAERAEERADRYEAEIRRLNESFGDKAIPALMESAKAMAAMSEEARNLLRRQS